MVKFLSLFLLVSLVAGCAHDKIKMHQASQDPFRPAIERELTSRATKHKLRQCYEEALLARPGREGRISMAWMINRGQVSDVRVVELDSGLEPVVVCVSNVIRSIEFNDPDLTTASEPVEVDAYPFYFSH